MTTNKIRVFTSFSGYDSQMLALNRLKEKYPGFDYECVGWSEIEPNAIKAHNALFPEDADKNKGDISKIDWKEVPDFDLFTYSSPCLTAGELILTETGYKPIKAVRPGDVVMTRSGWHSVAKKFNNGPHRTCYLHLDGMAPVHCTLNHKFWTKTKDEDPVFKEVSEMTEDDYVAAKIDTSEVDFLTSDRRFWFIAGLLSSEAAEISDPCREHAIIAPNDIIIKETLGTDYTVNDNSVEYKLTDDEYDMLDDFFNIGRLPENMLSMPKVLLIEFVLGFEIGTRIKNGILKTSVFASKRSFIILASCIMKATGVVPVFTENEENEISWSYEDSRAIRDEANGYMWIPFSHTEPGEIEEVYNIEVEEDHSYVVAGLVSKNCQDFSLAGNHAGGEKGSGTRSSLLWEVERAIREKRPKYLLLENVTALVSKRFLPLFMKWVETVNSYGYESFWSTLNAKDYGIPHNRDRVFLVSIKKERPDEIISYNFPNPIPLTRKVEDFFEPDDEVDEKYYVKQDAVDKWCEENEERIVECIAERNNLPVEDVEYIANDTITNMEEDKKTKKTRKKKAVAKEPVMNTLIGEPEPVVEEEPVIDEDELETESDENKADYEQEDAWKVNVNEDDKDSDKPTKPIRESLSKEEKKLRKGMKLIRQIPTPTCSDGTAPTLMATGYANADYKNFYSVGHFPKLAVFEIWKRVLHEEEKLNTLI